MSSIETKGQKNVFLLHFKFRSFGCFLNKKLLEHIMGLRTDIFEQKQTRNNSMFIYRTSQFTAQTTSDSERQ
jgi:hypothetical protein